MEGFIRKSTASGDAVGKVVEALENAVEGMPTDHVLIGTIVMSFLIMHPEISTDDLREGVTGVSEWMTLFLSSKESLEKDGSTPLSMLN